MVPSGLPDPVPGNGAGQSSVADRTLKRIVCLFTLTGEHRRVCVSVQLPFVGAPDGRRPPMVDVRKYPTSWCSTVEGREQRFVCTSLNCVVFGGKSTKRMLFTLSCVAHSPILGGWIAGGQSIYYFIIVDEPSSCIVGIRRARGSRVGLQPV